MCAIISWSGRIPQGLLTSLLLRGAKRGLDSTGFAFRGMNSVGKPTNYAYRNDEPASVFIENNGASLGDARRSLRGIGHTRNASPGMPVNPENAHPFLFNKMFFAHNGSIKNWVELKSSTVEWARQRYELSKLCEDPAVAEKAKNLLDVCTEYVPKCTTDSMILGPYIEARDFSLVKGCMALVWLRGPDAYTFRYGKEAVWSTLTWVKVDSSDAESVETATIVASTPEMIKGSLSKLTKVDYAYTEPVEYAEDTVYKITPAGLENEGTVPVNERIEDYFSSALVRPAQVDVQVLADEVQNERES